MIVFLHQFLMILKIHYWRLKIYVREISLSEENNKKLQKLYVKEISFLNKTQQEVSRKLLSTILFVGPFYFRWFFRETFFMKAFFRVPLHLLNLLLDTLKCPIILVKILFIWVVVTLLYIYFDILKLFHLNDWGFSRLT